jgi:hypothetical protein
VKKSEKKRGKSATKPSNLTSFGTKKQPLEDSSSQDEHNIFHLRDFFRFSLIFVNAFDASIKTTIKGNGRKVGNATQKLQSSISLY